MSSISPSRQQGELKCTVTCPICEAEYAPSPTRQDLLAAPEEVVEAAFMSLCHYCFRCRRPACPECWDAVHKVCGACVQEAQLPFRSESAPLKGTMFPPPAPASQVGHREAEGNVGISGDDIIAPLLMCVKPGRLGGEIVQIVPLPSPPPPRPRVPARGTPTMDERVSPEGLPSMVRVPLAGTLGGAAVFFRGVERVLNVVLGAILLSVIILIVVAELSATANAQLIWLFHIDIRSEIGYILYVIRQLRW